MNYHDKIEEITARIGGRFTDYRPETGSCGLTITEILLKEVLNTIYPVTIFT
jgi:hypothetical protein